MTGKDDGSIDININGQQYAANPEEIQVIHDSSGQALVRIEDMGPYVKLEFPKTRLYVYFDGYAVNIKVSG